MATEMEERPSLSPEQIEQLRVIQRRRLIIAMCAGIVLAVLGFFAGQYLKESRHDAGVAVAACAADSRGCVDGISVGVELPRGGETEVAVC